MTKPIKIFMHVNDLPGAFDLLGDQLTRMNESGLLDAATSVLLCSNGDPANFLPAQNALAQFRQCKWYHASNRTDLWEYPTLDLLKRNCDATLGNEEFDVCYLHLKGLSRLGDQRVVDWRNFLEHYSIDKWQQNVSKLAEGYEVVGTNVIEQPWLHSSGNFWWASSRYVKERLKYLPSPDLNIQWGTVSPYTAAVYDQGNFRYDHEAWVFSGQPNWFEIARTPGKDVPGWHFDNFYPQSNYV